MNRPNAAVKEIVEQTARTHVADGVPRRRRSNLTEIVLIAPTGKVVCDHCYVADRSLPRIRGLIGWRDLASNEGMLMRPSWSIHTAFVRFPIDVVFLDEKLSVISVMHRMRPWRIAWKRRAKAVLELPAGRCDELSLRPDDSLAWGGV